MSGAPDPLYVAARHILLDALEALGDHREAVVLVGAQAVYLRAGSGALAVAPYTTDADLAIDPGILASAPLLQDALEAAGFSRAGAEVGVWSKSAPIAGNERAMVVDLLVPESLGGRGRRGARIPPHDRRAARKVRGLEGALVDKDLLRIPSLNDSDARAYQVFVAGPAALLVAKTFKIADRSGDSDRQSDKDALDVLRLLQAFPADELVRRMRFLLAHDASTAVASQGLAQFADQFGRPRGVGPTMAARAAVPLESEETVVASLSALARRLLDALADLRTGKP